MACVQNFASGESSANNDNEKRTVAIDVRAWRGWDENTIYFCVIVDIV